MRLFEKRKMGRFNRIIRFVWIVLSAVKLALYEANGRQIRINASLRRTAVNIINKTYYSIAAPSHASSADPSRNTLGESPVKIVCCVQEIDLPTQHGPDIRN